jgi:1-pyrroline-5-carboxylate dehydrogenase
MKITYATMSMDNEELQSAFDRGADHVRDEVLGKDHPLLIDGREIWTEDRFAEHSPADRRVVVGRYSQAGPDHVHAAVEAAGRFRSEWDATPWSERIAIMRKAADLMEARTPELAALLTIEVGKSRLEALGDVAEAVEFLRYYSAQMEQHDGFVIELGALGPNEKNVSILRPYGVWAVISPFNFPMALSAGPCIGALIAGNTVVLKPSNTGALAGLEFARLMADAGLPSGALHVVTGGDETGATLVRHPGVQGITFTGSYSVGMEIYREFATDAPKPTVIEMGGKNPTIVTATADLDQAAEGVMRAAFGFSGQKCSACSRVYVEQAVYDAFIDRLVAATGDLVVGDPLERSSFTGPVIDDDAVARYRRALDEVRHRGGRMLVGGDVLTGGHLDHGNYVSPAIAEVDEESYLWKDEQFMPFLVVAPYETLDEAIDKANDTVFGLTAGLFSTDDAEIELFFRDIEAGTTYVNRRAGSTTGAWPDIQSFGGWKGSGSSGAGGGGPWYLRSYMREQSRTRIG